MTGEFTDEGLVDEVTGLTLVQMLELENWIKFYDENYVYKGDIYYICHVLSVQYLGNNVTFAIVNPFREHEEREIEG